MAPGRADASGALPFPALAASPFPEASGPPRHPSAILRAILGQSEAELFNFAATEARCTFVSVSAKIKLMTSPSAKQPEQLK